MHRSSVSILKISSNLSKISILGRMIQRVKAAAGGRRGIAPVNSSHVFFYLFRNDKYRECWYKMKPLPYMIFLSAVMLFIIYRITTIQYEETEGSDTSGPCIGNLPRGIWHSKSDMEVKPLWVTKSSKLKEIQYRNLLAMSVGIKQKNNVDIIVRKFLSENLTVMLFHYDGNISGWNNIWWRSKVIHIAANDQTKWYLKIVKSEGLEISQPALDPNLSEIHHRLTAPERKERYTGEFMTRGRRKCTKASEGPPCTGWVEGMAPVFSRSAWRCSWHLIQNDLIDGWGMDMKLGYCAQGDRTQKVGVIDSEFVVHRSVLTLRGSSKQQMDVLELLVIFSALSSPPFCRSFLFVMTAFLFMRGSLEPIPHLG